MTRLALFELASFVLELRKRQSISSSNSCRIEDDDVLNFRTLSERVFQFNELFTISEKENRRAGVVQNVTNLRRC